MKNNLDAQFEELNEALKFEISKANNEVVDEYKNVKDIRQGSKAWFYDRLGMFTGSKFPDLMKSGRSKADMFGETAMNYISLVGLERNLSEIGKELYVDELFKANFRQTEWGNKFEPFARNKYIEETGFAVEETSFRKSKIIPTMGGSFDGDVVGQKRIIEIKCPYNMLIHYDNVQLHLDGDGMQNHKYYGQIQCNIFVAEADSCDFISFDPRLKENSFVVINVPRDEEYINEMIKRVKIAEHALSMFEFIPISDAIILSVKAYNDGEIH